MLECWPNNKQGNMAAVEKGRERVEQGQEVLGGQLMLGFIGNCMVLAFTLRRWVTTGGF